MTYLVGIDIGGTFTDCAIVDAAGKLLTTKVPSTPIVPKRLIRGISERVDCFGEVIVDLNIKEAEMAIRELLAEGVQAIAICFLWSFRNPAHELRVRDLVKEISKEVFVTCSFDIA